MNCGLAFPKTPPHRLLLPLKRTFNRGLRVDGTLGDCYRLSVDHPHSLANLAVWQSLYMFDDTWIIIIFLLFMHAHLIDLIFISSLLVAGIREREWPYPGLSTAAKIQPIFLQIRPWNYGQATWVYQWEVSITWITQVLMQFAPKLSINSGTQVLELNSLTQWLCRTCNKCHCCTLLPLFYCILLMFYPIFCFYWRYGSVPEYLSHIGFTESWQVKLKEALIADEDSQSKENWEMQLLHHQGRIYPYSVCWRLSTHLRYVTFSPFNQERTLEVNLHSVFWEMDGNFLFFSLLQILNCLLLITYPSDGL